MLDSTSGMSAPANIDEIPAWLRAAAEHTARLTPRQTIVLGYLAQGMSAAAIARALACSERTVKLHTTEVVRRLELESRIQAALVGYHLTLSGALDTP